MWFAPACWERARRIASLTAAASKLNALRRSGRARAERSVVLLTAAAAICFVVVANIASLTRAPEPYGDEAWVGSAVWSFTHGHGLRPAIAAGSGIYDGTFDHWLPRIGILPQLAAEIAFGTSFTAYRAASLVVSFLALFVLWLGLRRLYPATIAALSVAVAATTWIFVSASHYIRWDDVTLLWASTIFTLLAWGPPTLRRTVALGLLIGVSPDFSVPTFAVLPATAFFVLLPHDGRRARATGLGVGVVAGLALYAGMHFVPDVSAARRQYRLVYGTAYRLPLFAALQEHSLGPILHEADRYRRMAVGAFAFSRTFLFAGCVAAMIAILAAVRRRGLPQLAVGSVLLLSQLAGLALLYANKGPAYAVGAVPFGAASLVEGLWALPRARFVAAALVLTAGAVLGGRAMLDGIHSSQRGAATDARVSRVARTLVGKDQVAIGDFVYWWLFRDQRFRFNAILWSDESRNHVTLAHAFRDACPDVVLYDDFWQARYPANAPGSLGYQFPALAPTDPNEEPKLLSILTHMYRFPPVIETAGTRTVTFWKRRAPTCRSSG